MTTKLYDLLEYRLEKFNKRIVFDILYQNEKVRFQGGDDDDYHMFVASNGVQIISRSRMDIQTERVWLHGGKQDTVADRSGSMVFANNEMRDKAFPKFHAGLQEWADHIHSGGRIMLLSDFKPKPPVAWRIEWIPTNETLGLVWDTDTLAYYSKQINMRVVPLYE